MLGLHWCYYGIMENKMETTIVFWGQYRNYEGCYYMAYGGHKPTY